MLHGMEADMRQMRQELEKQTAHQEDLRVKLLEFELLMKWRSLRDKQDPRPASQFSSSRPASAASSRAASPSPLEHKALLKLEAQICASMGDYQGMIKRAQKLSAASKKTTQHSLVNMSLAVLRIMHPAVAIATPLSATHLATWVQYSLYQQACSMDTHSPLAHHPDEIETLNSSF